ncbi:uncharacterized protein J8A68_003372 [[Candida] subhashii]|uniref:Carboxymuconolactone decarboxylase-like domain-containing protein n=1 Tax=[Candida] subhashii TaxID=561895 RepID=A0A8J5QVQ8_9ASCO|nr:uncharacterized protein J8A68_003372 [[Candida] subhashii]KAG7663100.1 hypothetical protein J8A68_003372 [[Candida] subhashii]
MPVLTPERLIKLAYSYPELHDTWYLYTVACFSELNLTSEITTVLRFALNQQLFEFCPYEQAIADEYVLQLATDVLEGNEETLETELPPSTTVATCLKRRDNTPEPCKVRQQTIVDKLREVLLKTSVMSGMPKAINSLIALKNSTPSQLIPAPTFKRESILKTHPGDQHESFIDGTITPERIDYHQVSKQLSRGSDFWNAIYTNQINHRIKNQLMDAYPDLWNYIYHHVYSPLLSFVDILPPKETSLSAIACMIPQDVNPQVKGHLRGAMNNGATREEVNHVREIVLDICDWKGGVVWKEGKESVPML